DLQDKVDAIGILGIFTYTDQQGNNVLYGDVLRWTADNSRLPDFSFWLDRVDYGTLCAVGVSGYQQGYVAGGLARRILVNGEKPSAIPMRPTMKGEPWVNLARMRRLDLPYRSTPLLSSRVVTTFRVITHPPQAV
ncbi:MAG: ABC transporter substrate binding protein, partial [Kiloniellales bacterium]|nr:ABC transporter substrate binding protein [Kiloniellales bacterium]